MNVILFLAMRALDLFCGAGGVSVGLQRAGFEVTGVDINPQPRYRGGVFVQADALTYPLDGYDFIWASPPCQAYTPLRSLHPNRTYRDLISVVRERLAAQPQPWCIENLPKAPLTGNLILLCGTMFGLQTPDGRAEIRRHRVFETSWPIALRPACQHGYVSNESLSVSGTGLVSKKERWEKRTLTEVGKKGLPGLSHARRAVLCVAGGKRMSGGMAEPQGMRRRRTMTVTGNTAQTNTIRNSVRQTYSIEDARAAMGIDWMTMKGLSQAIPPAYAEFIGHQVIAALGRSG